MRRVPSAGIILAIVVVAHLAGARLQGTEAAAIDLDHSFWSLSLNGYLPGTARITDRNFNIYAVRQEGRWMAAVCTSTTQGRANFNTALHQADLSQVTLVGNRVQGTVVVTMLADPWVPKDGKSRVVTYVLDAHVVPPADPAKARASLTGTWKGSFPGTAEDPLGEQAEGVERSGTLSGGLAGAGPSEWRDASVDFTFYDLIPGTTGQPYQRRRAVSLGIVAGKPVSCRIGLMDNRHAAYDYVDIATPDALTCGPHGISGSFAFAADTMDGQPASFHISYRGERVANWVVGTWQGRCAIDGGEPVDYRGHFRADVRKPAYVPAAVAVDERPWFTPVAGHVPVAPGEHPRLFFRRSDVPALRARAATPEGQRIIARLRELLGGGAAMPTHFNPATQADGNQGFKARPGSFSISHAAGFGFLYQITGEAAYADLARKCLELSFAGQRDLDDRYSWVAPGGELRAGPSLGWHAVAYDLCYDAWDPAFRVQVAKAIQDYDGQGGGETATPESISLRQMVLAPKHGPGSNHFGGVVGGCGLAVLAIKGDPGTDDATLAAWDDAVQQSLIRAASFGWGDGGFFNEGMGPGQIGSDSALIPYVQALRVAAGRDYLRPRPNLENITMVRVLELLGPSAHYPYRGALGPTYGGPDFARQRHGLSRGGQFVQGFGAVRDELKPALLWTYQQYVESDPGACTFDTVSLYPHRPMLALINWPIGTEAVNPARVMPQTMRDSRYEYFAFRNGWRDAASDVVATALVKPPSGTKPRGVMVWGYGGLRITLGELPRGKVVHYRPGKDGSAVLQVDQVLLAVDYSAACGADVLVAIRRPGTAAPSSAAAPSDVRVQRRSIAGAGVTWEVLTFARDAAAHPTLRLEEGTLVVGGQRIGLDAASGQMAMAVFAPAP